MSAILESPNFGLSDEELQAAIYNARKVDSDYNALPHHRRRFPNMDFWEVVSQGAEKLRKDGAFEGLKEEFQMRNSFDKPVEVDGTVE